MLTFARLFPETFSTVARLGVAEEQLPFVGRMSSLLEKAVETSHYHAIHAGQEVIGFFNLDTVYGDTYPFSFPGELGLRAFFIDRRYQGRGYGKAACLALGPYLEASYGEYPSIALTVNCRNRGALKVYLAGGFSDTGELYHGGRAGPQHILRMSLGGRQRGHLS
ncbi:MAG: GNAT family N-acetyltransferase [Gammaproteobacteria bacterium]|jgi:RimJ/RimL family protein N-acetyltransferase